MGVKVSYSVLLLLALFLLSSFTTAKKERENPYVFSEDDFETMFHNQYGRDLLLPKFTKLSNHLKLIENFRVEIFEANPMTFMLPKHCDADAFFFVANGKGTITLVNPENRESFNIESGHIMNVPAGTTVYLINGDDDESLILIRLMQPVNNPGQFRAFFGAGGNPESFFHALSQDVLEAQYKVPRHKLGKLFGKQEQGGVLKRASKEQIRAMRKEVKNGKGSNGPLNIFNQSPIYSNEFGKLIDIGSDEFKKLRDLNMRITFANITQGGMHALHYNTRAIKIAVVIGGKGRLEIVSPHLTAGEWQYRQKAEEETKEIHYEKMIGELRIGSVFIVPAGHPFVTMASTEENLEIICFGVNAEDSEKVLLAGKRSVFKKLERNAKELAFGEKAEVVDELLEEQKEEFFFEGPRSRGSSDE